MARIEKVLAGEATWGEWWLDQLGHAGLGAAWAAPVSVAGAWLGWCWELTLAIAAVTALFGGVLREVAQYAKSGKLHFWDRFWDSVFHLPGAPIVVGLAWLVKALI